MLGQRLRRWPNNIPPLVGHLVFAGILIMFVLSVSYKDRVLTYFFPILITLCWLLVMGIAIRNIVYDKEHRLEEVNRQPQILVPMLIWGIRWANLKSTLVKCLVFAGNTTS